MGVGDISAEERSVPEGILFGFCVIEGHFCTVLPGLLVSSLEPTGVEVTPVPCGSSTRESYHDQVAGQLTRLLLKTTFHVDITVCASHYTHGLVDKVITLTNLLINGSPVISCAFIVSTSKDPSSTCGVFRCFLIPAFSAKVRISCKLKTEPLRQKKKNATGSFCSGLFTIPHVRRSW